MEGLRWMYQGEFMVYNGLYPGVDTTPTVPQFALGRQSAETQAAYYDRPVTRFRHLPENVLQQVPRERLMPAEAVMQRRTGVRRSSFVLSMNSGASGYPAACCGLASGYDYVLTLRI